ncbi:hypothetical protein RRF57_008469 [Xylaria bambusicola]|uniref:Ubiquitin 3 binding protein But2 C-terminal domain-containing protein n=1 Tax=Xylaria bambusicola TaxID=326684 RepID=A0AAN7UHW7_9PEZI
MLVMLIPLVSILWMHTLDPVDAHATRDNVGCSFHLSCSGAFNGSVGEKGSGQAHAGSDVSTPSLFTWFGDAFADQQGSGCWWTPPTFTLQCDKNQPPDHGFQIGCDGALSFHDQSVFYECPTGEGDEVNLYLHPVGDQCHEVTIHADNCAPSTCPGAANSPSTSASSQTVPFSATTLVTTPSSPNSPPGGPSSGPATLSSSTTSHSPLIPTHFTIGGGTTKTSITSTSTIVTTVPGSDSGSSTSPPSSTSSCVETGPDQVILTDLGNPDTAYGPNDGKRIQVSPNASSIFNFRFDNADVGKTCQISFRLTSSPTSPHGEGGVFNLTGTGIVVFEALEGWADSNTTYNSMPRVVQTMDDAVLFDGL